MDIEALYQKANTSRRHAAHPVYPYLLRGLTIDTPNQVWAMDTTYIPMRRGFVYLTAVLDWATRRVLAWRLSNSLGADVAVAALEEAIAKYGSEAAATRWVATPKTSAHVSGDAVDIGPADAAAWLSEHGAAYGLCQIYGNEPWHYELRPEAIDQGCPPMYADPTHDPRMRQ